MENKKFGCYVMAEAIQAIMAMANFSGHLNQEDRPQQFRLTCIDGDEERATLRFTFSGQDYKAEITLDEAGGQKP